MAAAAINSDSVTFHISQNEDGGEASLSSSMQSKLIAPASGRTITLFRRDYTYRELAFIFVSLAMAVAAFGLMITVIITDQAVANEKKLATCTDYDCYVSAASVQRKMNASLEPCDNFYKYACGQWIDNVKLLGNERERTILSEMDDENMKRLNDAIMGEIDLLRTPEWTYESKLKTMFKTCLDQYQTTNLYEKNNPLLEQIKAMGGWYVLNTFDKNKFYWPTAHRETLARDNFINVFFDYEVEPTSGDHRKYEITITEDFDLALPYWRWSIPGAPFLPSYKTFLKDVAKLMAEDAFVNDQDLDSRIDEFVNDVITVEQGIAEALKKHETESDGGGNYQRRSLASMWPIASGFDWNKYFTTTFAETRNPITYSTEVWVRSPRTLADISQFLNRLSYAQTPQIFNNYLVWRLIYSWLPDMSFEYNHQLLRWKAKLAGPAGVEYKPSWTQCMDRAQRYMRDALDGLFIRHHFTRLDNDELTSIEESLRKNLMKEVGTLDWMDESTRQIASEKVAHVRAKTGFPDFMNSDVDMQNMLDFAYRHVHVNNTNHFNNMVQLRQHARREYVGVWTTGLDPLASWRSIPIYSQWYAYYYPWNEVMLTAGLLQFPVFSGFNPAMFRMMTYGSVGYRIARGYINAIGEAGRLYDKTGKYMPDKPWWSNDTLKNYESKKQCLTDWYSKVETDYLTLNDGERVKQKLLDPQFYAKMAIMDIGAVRNAFAAYTNAEVQSQPKTANELFLPGTPAKSKNEYFFLGFAQTFCAVRRDQATFEEMNRRSNFLPEEFFVNNILMQLPEFAETFQCSAGSQMNPGNGCSAVF